MSFFLGYDGEDGKSDDEHLPKSGRTMSGDMTWMGMILQEFHQQIPR